MCIPQVKAACMHACRQAGKGKHSDEPSRCATCLADTGEAAAARDDGAAWKAQAAVTKIV